MEEFASRAEAQRLLGIAEKQLQNRDLIGSREFAVLAQETAPLLDGSDLILAITDVLLAADKRINNRPNWYAILQLDARTDDLDLLKKQYRRLALLLHPDKNKFAFAHDAFQLVADAWSVLSDRSKKALYDNEFHRYTRVDLVSNRKSNQLYQQQQRQQSRKANNNSTPPGRRNAPVGRQLTNFWTACPYCYNLYEYPRVYIDCCVKCENCNRAIHAAEVPSLPPVVPGKDAYYCCWGFFPMGFTEGKGGSAAKMAAEIPNWMPPMFGGNNVATGTRNGTEGLNVNVNLDVDEDGGGDDGFVDVSQTNGNQNGNVTPVHKPTPIPTPGARKRGRPRKIR